MMIGCSEVTAHVAFPPPLFAVATMPGMVMLLGAVGVTFAAVCVLLAVRIVNRPKKPGVGAALRGIRGKAPTLSCPRSGGMQ